MSKYIYDNYFYGLNIFESSVYISDTLFIKNIPAATVATNDRVVIQDANDSSILKSVSAQSIADLAAASGTTMSGTTANGVLTYDSAGVATVEPYLTFDGSTLTLATAPSLDAGFGTSTILTRDSAGNIDSLAASGGDASAFLRSDGTWASIVLKRVVLRKSAATEDLQTTVKYIQWDSQYYIDASVFTHSTVTNNSRLEVEEAGVYRIIANVTANNPGTNRASFYVKIRVNGTTVEEGSRGDMYSRGAVYNSDFSAKSITVLSLSANDYIEVEAYVYDADQTTAVTTLINGTELIVEQIATTALTNTWRPITDTPSADSGTSISANWALDASNALGLKAPIASPTFTGTVTIPTPFTLGATSVTTTGTRLNYLTSAGGTTGTTSANLVFSTSPALTTPTVVTSIVGGISFDVFNTTSTTINAFGAATSLTIGATTGTITFSNATATFTNATTLNINGASPTIAASSTGTLSLFNTNLLTVNAFGAATSLTIGATTGTMNLRNGTIVLTQTPATDAGFGTSTLLSRDSGGNVDVIAASGGSASVYLNGAGAWTAPAGGGGALSTLSDVSISSIAANEILKWNGSIWINNTLSEAGIAPVASPTFTGTVTIPTPFTLGATSVTTTGTRLNYLTSAGGTTGTTSTNIVFSTSPALTTPTVVTSIVGGATFAAFNTTTTNLSLGGAATTMTIGGTPTGAVTHNYSTNATANTFTKSINIGTGGASGSTTNILIGSATSGATGTTTLHSTTINFNETPATDAGFSTSTLLSRDSGGNVDVIAASGGGTTTFLRADGTWAASTGNVAKVGTPIDNQIAIWTGDGSIEGNSFLTFNAGTLDVSGAIQIDNININGNKILSNGDEGLTIEADVAPLYLLSYDASIIITSGNGIKMDGPINFIGVIHQNYEPSVGTGTNISWIQGNYQSVNLNATRTYTFTAPSGPAQLTLKIVHDGTGGAYDITWPTKVKWGTSGEPTWTGMAANETAIVSFYYDSSTYFAVAELGF